MKRALAVQTVTQPRVSGRWASAALLAALLVSAAIAPAVLAVEPGDEPATAIAVDLGTATFDSSSMTENPAADPPECVGDFAFPGPLSNTMWFEFTASRRGALFVDVNSFVSADGSTDFLAGVFVLTEDLGVVGCAAFPATVTFEAQRGRTYLIMVTGLPAEFTQEPGLSDRGGTFELTIGRQSSSPIFHERFVGTFSGIDEFWSEQCGAEITIDLMFRGALTGFRDGSAVFRGVERTTLEGPGGRIYVRAAFSLESVGEVTVDDEAGTITFHFEDTYTGLPVAWIVPGKGKLMLDAGQITFTFTEVFDLETGEPISSDFEILDVRGPHPIAELPFEEQVALFCGALT
jgi:hypothetical protein